METNKIDIQILRELHRDGRITIAKLARTIDVPAQTVQERVQALEDSGMIQGYTPRLGYETLGFDVTVIFRLSVDGDELTAITEHLHDEPRLIAVYEVTGRFNVIAIGKYADPDELNEYLAQLLTDPAIHVIDPMFVQAIASEDTPLNFEEMI